MDLKEFLQIEAKLRKEHPELQNWEIEFVLQLVLEGVTLEELEKEAKKKEGK